MLSARLEEQFRAVGIRKLSVIAGLVIALFVPISWSMGLKANAVAVGIASALFLTVPLVLRASSLGVATNYLAAIGALTFTGLAVIAGGIRSPALAGFTLIPLAVVFTLGRWPALVWTAISVACIVGLYLAGDVYGVLPAFEAPAHYGVLILGTLSVVIALTLWFALQFAGLNAKVIARLETTNRHTRDMASHLEGTSRDLSQAAESFVREGLLDLLAQKASSGRESIADARRGLSLMIEQYERISGLVVTLYEQMDRITELVLVIDRVSDRLDLMALNVGIEAARAGEVGKNFQILAQDMRRMSERVIHDTKEVNALLRDIGTQAAAARDATDRGIALTKDGNQRIDSMASSFDEVCALLESTAGAARNLTRATLDEIASVQSLVTAAIRDAGEAPRVGTTDRSRSSHR